jgi:hypothetical protein
MEHSDVFVWFLELRRFARQLKESEMMIHREEEDRISLLREDIASWLSTMTGNHLPATTLLSVWAVV